MKTKDLDRIEGLGFDINIMWNKDISIHYIFKSEDDYSSDQEFILIYIHPVNSPIKFENVIPSVIEEFNSWYLDNRQLIDEYSINCDPLIKERIKGMGDVSNKIYRDLRIGGIVKEDYDF